MNRLNSLLSNRIVQSAVCIIFAGILVITGVFAEGSSLNGEGSLLSGESVIYAAAKPAIPKDITPDAPGTNVEKNDYAIVDYSNTADGYIMVKYTVSTKNRLKVQLKGPKTTYLYNLDPGVYVPFCLSDGNGKYQVAVCENTSGTKYSVKLQASFEAKMTDEFAPFLRPNQYVDFTYSTTTVSKAKELVKGKKKVLDKVQSVYDYVTVNFSYDYDLASSVQSGYIPVLDSVMKKKKGICFDYAAVMSGMLRSQGVPCKLVIGYAGTQYHAWVNVYSKETGWIDGAIYFDGKKWQLLDPTFASSKKKKSKNAYVGDGKNYTEKYCY